MIKELIRRWGWRKAVMQYPCVVCGKRFKFIPYMLFGTKFVDVEQLKHPGCMSGFNHFKAPLHIIEEIEGKKIVNFVVDGDKDSITELFIEVRLSRKSTRWIYVFRSRKGNGLAFKIE